MSQIITTKENFTNKNEGNMDLLGTIRYSSSYIGGNVESYGKTNIEYNNYNQSTNLLTDSQIFRKTITNESINKPLYSIKTLPVRFFEVKVNKPIIDNNIKSRPVIYGGNNIYYDQKNQTQNFNWIKYPSEH